jgi:hypothetical protein
MRRIISTVLLVAVVGVCCLAIASANAMTLEQMAAEAKHIWCGIITDVEFKEHEQEGFLSWRNRQYKLTVNVTDVAKTRGLPEKEPLYHNHELSEKVMRHHEEQLPPHEGEGKVDHPEHVDDPLHDDETIAVGEEIHVHFWRAISRPPGYKMPDAPGVHGMRSDVVIDETGKKFCFFGEYLHRDHIRRSMYRHTHPGKVRRRKHTMSKSKSKSGAEGDATTADAVDDFVFVKAYVAYIPDGITDDVDAALAAASGVTAGSQPDKTDL